MTDELDVAVIGDRDESYTLHLQTDDALHHAAQALGAVITIRWVAPAELDDDLRAIADADALLCGPAPAAYSSTAGALGALRYGREAGVPTLATCGGCQHAVLEYARNVLGIADAAHAQTDPDAPEPVVSPLACSLIGRTGTVALQAGSKAAGSYEQAAVSERYFCSYGANPRYEDALQRAGLAITGRDQTDGVARIFEIPAHRFYVATLFVPQARSTPAEPHPLVLALLAAARAADTRGKIGAGHSTSQWAPGA
jgi:CTP synthase (UTP-ammonia lyase)